MRLCALYAPVNQVGPLAVAVDASEWAMYEKGILEQGDVTVNHAVLLVGYGTDETTGEDYYKIRNSWGADFGENGYIRIKRTADDDNLCGMDTDPLMGIDCALDEDGKKIDVKPVKVCSMSGVIFDVSYPVGVHRMH